MAGHHFCQFLLTQIFKAICVSPGRGPILSCFKKTQIHYFQADFFEKAENS